ncbi:restriction endonuclease subunit S [Variovorax sp. RHLX14]
MDNGDAQVIQMRDISAASVVAWPTLVRTSLSGSRSPDWLKDGDLLFAARGTRNYAICLENVPARTVCAQYFFVLRIKKAHAPDVLPAYLAWHMNSGPCQRYLASNAEGTNQLSIRRTVLEDMPIAIPPLERQQFLVSLAAAASRERRCLEALIQTREQQLDALANQLLSTRTLSIDSPNRSE